MYFINYLLVINSVLHLLILQWGMHVNSVFIHNKMIEIKMMYYLQNL